MAQKSKEDRSKLSRRDQAGDQRGQEFVDITKSVLENDLVGITVLDAEGIYRVFNRGAEHLTGYRREDVLGEVPPPDLFMEECRDAIRDALRTRGSIKNMEARLRRRDGIEKEVILSMSPQVGKDKNTIGYVQFLIDNAEKKHLQQLLLHSQKMEIVGEMAGGIAHDFNNLLEGILGYTTFMMDLIGDNHELRSYLGIIERSAKKASDLTERLLTFSGDKGGEEQLVNCNTLAKEVVKLLERTVDKRIVIEMNLERNLKAVRGAAGQLEQAFLNVCLNARDAMPDGGKLLISSGNVIVDETYPRLSWKMQRGSYVRISISDSGMGMDKETQGKIFEPFFTTKRRGEGTGLGLNVVYGIVDRHEGFINVYSESGRGTVFNIYLLAHQKDAPEEDAPRKREKAGGGRNEMVLVIDDEEMLRDLSREMLEKLGYRAITAEGADEGLRLFRENIEDIDLVVLDIIMPGASGREVLGRMKEMKKDILVLISSGYNMAFIGEELVDNETVNFIQKPYSMDDLAREIRRLIERRRR